MPISPATPCSGRRSIRLATASRTTVCAWAPGDATGGKLLRGLAAAAVPGRSLPLGVTSFGAVGCAVAGGAHMAIHDAIDAASGIGMGSLGSVDMDGSAAGATGVPAMSGVAATALWAKREEGSPTGASAPGAVDKGAGRNSALAAGASPRVVPGFGSTVPGTASALTAWTGRVVSMTGISAVAVGVFATVMAVWLAN